MTNQITKKESLDPVIALVDELRVLAALVVDTQELNVNTALTAAADLLASLGRETRAVEAARDEAIVAWDKENDLRCDAEAEVERLGRETRALRALAENWRAKAERIAVNGKGTRVEDMLMNRATTFHECADELDAALASPSGATTQ